MSAHTPGPWVVSTESLGWANIDAPNNGSSWYQLAKVAVKLDRQPSDEGIANARLISAAPDLFVALNRFDVDGLELEGDEEIDITMTAEDLRILRAAIAKAKGLAHE